MSKRYGILVAQQVIYSRPFLCHTETHIVDLILVVFLVT
jgi:hypothetical protein